MAILRALAWSQKAASVDNVIIVTDSQYSVNVLTKVPDHRRSVYPLPKNIDLIRIGRSLVTSRHKFEWVKGHSGNHWNECADRLATKAVRGIPAKRVFLPRPSPHAPLSALYPQKLREVLSEA